MFSYFKKQNLLIAFTCITILVFVINFYFMATLPGERDFQCVMGAGLTPVNIIFSLIQSVLMAFVFVGIFILHKQRHEGKEEVALLSLSGIGAFFGSLTVFCTFCTFPIISLFGASFALSVFTDYEWVFKIVSLILLGGSAYFLHKQIQGQCVFGLHFSRLKKSLKK